MTTVIKCICAFTGTLGIGVLFNIRGRNLVFAAFGGALSYMVYCFSDLFIDTSLGQYFLAAFAISLYCECMAMIRKVPVTIFLVTSMIPLVPGGVIFYTMQTLFMGNMEEAAQLGTYAFGIAGAIALGVLSMSFIVRAIKQAIRNHANRILLKKDSSNI